MVAGDIMAFDPFLRTGHPAIRNNRNDGFQQESLPSDVKVLNGEIEIPNDTNISEQYFQNRLAEIIANQLLKDEFISFSKIKKPTIYGVAEFLKGTLMVLNPKGRNNKYYMIPEDVFTYHDQKWTKEEIFESLKNTFPERFI
jgi:hypothetical protein